MRFRYKSRSFDIEGVSQTDHIFKSIAKTGTFYEIDLLKYMYYLRSFLNPDGGSNVVIDVGANIGNHSIFMRSFLSDNLISIEPNPKVIPILRRNLSVNIENYTLYECAVGHEKDLGLIVNSDNSNNNIGMAKIKPGCESGNIEINTLDSIVEKWQLEQVNPIEVSLIKIDVEGMELDVLKGAERTIVKYKPHIFAEAASIDEFNKLNDFLRNIGYRKVSKWAATPVYHFAHNPSTQFLFSVRYAQLLVTLLKIKARLVK